jgi:hypothetical protein
MSTNLQTLHLSGTVLLSLGVLIAVLSIGLFIAVSHGVHEGIPIAEADRGVVGEDGSLTFPHVDVMVPGMKERIVFLLPVVAGILMAVSGLLIRSKVPEWKATFGEAREFFNSGEFSGGDGDTPVK